jgi:hypothetical protein
VLRFPNPSDCLLSKVECTTAVTSTGNCYDYTRHTCTVLPKLVTVQTDYGDCCPYIVQYIAIYSTPILKTDTFLSQSQFLNGLMNFDKDKLDDALLGKMRKYINDPEYTPEKVGAVSGAAKGLCQWVHAMFIYGNVAKEVAPKRARLKAAQEALKKKQEALREAEKKLKLVLDKVQALKDTYEVSTSNKKALEDELADLEAKVRVLPFPNPADCVPIQD